MIESLLHKLRESSSDSMDYVSCCPELAIPSILVLRWDASAARPVKMPQCASCKTDNTNTNGASLQAHSRLHAAIPKRAKPEATQDNRNRVTDVQDV